MASLSDVEPSKTAGRIPQVGEILGRYRILEVIGRGSSGPVYRAWDASLIREVALKTLWPQYLAEGGVRSRFEREARAAARLESPFVVRVYDIGESDGIPYIAMEFIGGGPVCSDSGRAMEWRRACEIVRDVAEGLALAHSLGIIHRDIKPANVMLGPDGRAKIADFGLARAIAEESHTVTTTGTILGTPAYLAPEIIEGEESTPLSDIYSVGILLYRLVTGRLPFEGSSPAAVLRGHLEGSIARVSGGTGSSGPGTEIPASIDSVIAGCTARRPEARYAQADLVMCDLEACLAGRAPAGAQPQAISADLPFWARYLPGAERTVMEVRNETSRARQRLEAAQKSVRESENSARELESKAKEAEKNATGWRVVAERVLVEGKEDEAREALGYAREYDNHAKAYRDELTRHNEMLAELRRRSAEIKSATDKIDVRGKVLLARRGLAKLVLGESVRRNPKLLSGFVVLFITIVSFAAYFTFTRLHRSPVSQNVFTPETKITVSEAQQNHDPADPEEDAPPLNGVLSANFRPSGSSGGAGGVVISYRFAATCAIAGGPEIPSAVNPWGRVTHLVFETGESVDFNYVPQPRGRGLKRIENRIFEAYFTIPPPRRPARRIREITGVIECFVGPAEIRDVFMPFGDSHSFKAGHFDLSLETRPPIEEAAFNTKYATQAARVFVHQDSSNWSAAQSITWYIRFSDQSEKPAYTDRYYRDGYNLHYNGPPEKQRAIGIRAEWVSEPPIRRLGTLRAENVPLTFASQ